MTRLVALQGGADLGRADRQRGARSQRLLDEPRIRPAFEAFCCGLAVSACPTCLRLARSRLWLARRSTAPCRCRRSRQVLCWSLLDPRVGSLRSLPSPFLTILGNHRRRALPTRG